MDVTVLLSQCLLDQKARTPGGINSFPLLSTPLWWAMGPFIQNACEQWIIHCAFYFPLILEGCEFKKPWAELIQEQGPSKRCPSYGKCDSRVSWTIYNTALQEIHLVISNVPSLNPTYQQVNSFHFHIYSLYQFELILCASIQVNIHFRNSAYKWKDELSERCLHLGCQRIF